MKDKIIFQLQKILAVAGYNIGRFLAFVGKKVEGMQSTISTKRQIESPRSVLITGASSGIGAELARQYAAPGVFLYLTGRNANRLAKVAHECTARGAKTDIQVMDVCDDQAMTKWIAELPRIDLAIANAGVSGGTAEGIDNDEVREIFSVNVGGVINVVLPMIEKARKQQLVGGMRGQIAIISSMSSLRGLPSSPAYSASKACVSAYAEALNGSLKHEKIVVSSINPGYIRTPLTATNNFKMPLLLEVDEAAYKIRKGIYKRKTRVYFPLRIYLLLRLLNLLPNVVTDPIFRALPKK